MSNYCEEEEAVTQHIKAFVDLVEKTVDIESQKQKIVEMEHQNGEKTARMNKVIESLYKVIKMMIQESGLQNEERRKEIQEMKVMNATMNHEIGCINREFEETMTGIAMRKRQRVDYEAQLYNALLAFPPIVQKFELGMEKIERRLNGYSEENERLREKVKESEERVQNLSIDKFSLQNKVENFELQKSCLTSNVSKVMELHKASIGEKEKIARNYAKGFENALSQVRILHPGINLEGTNVLKVVKDGAIVDDTSNNED
ncbi:hypothetical protein SESBI_32297 [Sesbania bispinosa]|nr:hypothetical protein SESBI_32297 [Sesbania bispinosa]